MSGLWNARFWPKARLDERPLFDRLARDGLLAGGGRHAHRGPALLGVNVPLALKTSLHSDRPDNLLRTILEGVREPPSRHVGFMPGFAAALDDRQIVELAAWMRQRHAPGRPAWTDLAATVARLRAQPTLP